MPNCKVGDLCIVKALYPENNGKIVRVLGVAAADELQSLDPSQDLGTRFWKISENLLWKRGGRVITGYFPVAPDVTLIPIAGDRFAEDTTKQKELENA